MPKTAAPHGSKQPKKIKLNLNIVHALKALNEGDLHHTELANKIGITKQALSYNLDKLTKAGLVKRIAETRVSAFSITKTGKKALSEVA